MNDVFTRAPRRRPEIQNEYAPHAALLIDFDNVTMGIRSNLGNELRKLLASDIIGGKVTIQRAYADWRRYPQYIVPLSEASIDLIFAPAYGSSKKNATDIRLAIDALEIVFTRPEIGTFILLSGDSDFSAMVLKLKEYGKYVIGVGMQESSSDILVQNCDEYYSYTSLSGLQSAAEMNTERYDPWELAGQAIERMVARKDVMRSDRFKQVMLELDPSFSEKALGFSKFNRFLTESASRGIIDLHKAANGQYEVGPGPGASDYAHRAGKSGTEKTAAAQASSGSRAPAKTPASGGSRAQEQRSSSGRSSSRRGRGRSKTVDKPAPTFRPEETPQVDEDRLRQAYGLLQKVVEAKVASGGPVRDSEVKRQMLEVDPSFDEGALGFAKFSRFLRQAHDEEVINLERNSGGNLLITPVSGSSSASKAEDRGPKREPRRREPPKSEAATPSAEEPSVAPPSAEEPKKADRPRRGLGRLHRGPRKAEPSQPATSAPAASAPAVEERAEPSERFEPSDKADPAEFDADAAVDRMSQSYPGVGRRTAQRLVDEFGADVFVVIDRSPDRVKSVLPAHRAQAVLDGRKGERKSGGPADDRPRGAKAKARKPRQRKAEASKPKQRVAEAAPAPDEPKPAPDASQPEPEATKPAAEAPAKSRLARRTGGRRR